MNLKLKVIVGFRKDQEHTIDADEAHKAYYLFLHPEARTIFKSGLALTGADIKEIVPDYHASMGWNATYTLTSDDWNEIRDAGVDVALRRYLNVAQEVARVCEPAELNMPLKALVKEKYALLETGGVERREGVMKRIGEVPPSAKI